MPISVIQRLRVMWVSLRQLSVKTSPMLPQGNAFGITSTGMASHAGTATPFGSIFGNGRNVIAMKKAPSPNAQEPI